MIWVCEYSPKQKAFHIDTVDRVLEINRQTAAQGVETGYAILCIAATSEDAHAFAEQFEREYFSGYQPPKGSNHSKEG